MRSGAFAAVLPVGLHAPPLDDLVDPIETSVGMAQIQLV